MDLRTERQTGGLLPTPFKFQPHGQERHRGQRLLPQLAGVIDDICVIRSMYSFNPTHTPACSLWHTGTVLATRPSIGSWVSYGLGSENDNLPSFVALGGGGSPTRTGFLPAQHQGIALQHFRAGPGEHDPGPAEQVAGPEAQRRQLDALQALNRQHSEAFGADEFLEGRIQSMESAYRMQFAALDRLRRAQGADGDPRGIWRRRLSPTAACWPAAWSSAACATSTSTSAAWDDHKDLEKSLRKSCPTWTGPRPR